MNITIRGCYDEHIKDKEDLMGVIRKVTSLYLKLVIALYFSKKETLPLCTPIPAREFLYDAWFHNACNIHGIRNRLSFLSSRPIDASGMSRRSFKSCSDGLRRYVKLQLVGLVKKNKTKNGAALCEHGKSVDICQCRLGSHLE